MLRRLGEHRWLCLAGAWLLHRWLCLAGAWLLLGAWVPVLGGPLAWRVSLLLCALLVVGGLLVLRRLRTLAKAGVKVGPLRLAGMLFREVRNRAVFRRQFRRACLANTDTRVKMEGGRYGAPYLYRLTWLASEDFTAVIYPGRMGVPKGGEAFVARQDSIRRTLGVKDFRVRERPDQPGVFDLGIYQTDLLEREYPLSELPWGPPGTLEYARRRDGLAAWIYAHMSLLVCGLTRKGKSVMVRVLLASLQRKNIPTKLYFADPKGGVQFGEWNKVGRRVGCLEVAGYEKDPEKIAAMVSDMAAQMNARLESMARRGVTQHVPTPEEPAMIAIFDETIPLKTMLTKGVDSPTGRIAYLGAGACFAVWMLTQLSEKAILDQVRDLIPQRVCFSVQTWQQTDMALGSGASQAGALSHKIGDVAGIGYSGSDRDPRFYPFRVPNVDDSQARDIAKGKLPPGFCDPPAAASNRPWFVYHAEGVRRFEDGTVGPVLLYVGKSDSVNRRIKEHKAEPDPAGAEWRTLVWRVRTVSQHASEKAALKAEEKDIRDLGPYWNIVHNDGNELHPDSDRVVLVPKPARLRAGRRKRPTAAVAEPVEDVESFDREPLVNLYGSE